MRMLAGLGLAIGLVPAAVAQAPRTAADYSFEYRYPRQAGRIAPLKAWLEADKAALRTRYARMAATARRDSVKHGYPFHPYQAMRDWKLVTDTPRFLSLSVSTYSFTGGAHGNTRSGGLLWDKRTGRRVQPKTVFVSDAALQAAVMPTWCRWMRGERARRLGEPVSSDAMFGKCPPVADVTVLPGSSNGRAIDRIGVIADQYLVGSYAEGQYETTIPVTAAILRAVKPAYRDAFAVR